MLESQLNEIAHLLRVQQAQQHVIDEFKIMIEGFKSLKRNLKQVWKVGWRAGSSWPLWVTEVCCELLVNGSPPSAIPSSIGTLIATLHGDEPKKLPLLNYVQQCRVLMKIIAKMITAMKLASCLNWAEIFFNSATCRQVPFTAVVISLMGDEPESIDSIIVSLCVVLEDETSEMQVDGIVNKVSFVCFTATRTKDLLWLTSTIVFTQRLILLKKEYFFLLCNHFTAQSLMS